MTEPEFWDSTLAEINRRIESYNRKYKSEQRDKATAEYMLANLIGISVARLFDSNAKMPTVYECFPGLFSGEETHAAQQTNQNRTNASRFLAFALNHNQQIKQKEVIYN